MHIPIEDPDHQRRLYEQRKLPGTEVREHGTVLDREDWFPEHVERQLSKLVVVYNLFVTIPLSDVRITRNHGK
eukprot:229776-Rhodomonas_salina.1